MGSPDDHFNLLGKAHWSNVFEDYEDYYSGKNSSALINILASIRHHHAGMTVAITTTENVDLIMFANFGNATAELDTTNGAFIQRRYYEPPRTDADPGALSSALLFGRYTYVWNRLEFILYKFEANYTTYQVVLFPPDDDETVLSNSKTTDALLLAAGLFEYKDGIYVFDEYEWRRSAELLKEVQKISWRDVILDDNKKRAVTRDIQTFFDNESKYKEFNIPWKRGIIFYGPPGNGKTISLRALMHSLNNRPHPVNLLYVKSMNGTWDIRRVFSFARYYAPCLLILEDIDSIIREDMQSYFFNEVDGLENNDGILMIATTNHLDKLDGGLKNRPSRFDRKYEFSDPSETERVMYCELWRKKLTGKPVEFPKELSPMIAGITDQFSFAYIKEAFVSTLLALVNVETDIDLAEFEELGIVDHGGSDDSTNDKRQDKDIDHLPLWVEMQKQVKILRDDMDAKPTGDENRTSLCFSSTNEKQNPSWVDRGDRNDGLVHRAWIGTQRYCRPPGAHHSWNMLSEFGFNRRCGLG